MDRSFTSSRALPPVSAPSVHSVSCDLWMLVMAVRADAPVYIANPPGDPLLASPSGADAVRPRASIGQNETPARIAALMVACSWAWLLLPFSRRPLAK